MLQSVGECLAFNPTELGRLHSKILEPIIIRTVPHKAWEYKPMRFPLEMKENLLRILHDRLSSGLLELFRGPYANRYFLVKKKSGKWRFILDVQPLNNVSIRDANLPPKITEIVEKVSNHAIYSTMDALSGYEQIPLAEESRDLTAFNSDLGLLRSTTIPQGWTGSVAEYERAMKLILGELKGYGIDNMIDDFIVYTGKLDSKGNRDSPIQKNTSRLCT